MAMGTLPASLLFIVVVLSSLLPSAIEGHNITSILHKLPEYSVYNSLLTKTKVAEEVNSRSPLTVLVLPNGPMTSFASSHHRIFPALQNSLRLLVLLDYFDPQKLYDLPGGTTLSATLYQATGTASGDNGFVNITDLGGGRVAFGSAASGSKVSSVYTKSIRQIPQSISVLEISSPIVFPGLLDGPSSADVNLTALLEKSGCRTFAFLLSSSGMIKELQAAMEKGLTLFAPNDEAFKAKGVTDLSALSNADLVTLLQYHAIEAYIPINSLKAARRPIATMASGGPGNYELTTSFEGNDVTIHTGVDSSRIVSTILDETPVCILTVDRVLLPAELFGMALSPAPIPVVMSPSPSPTARSQDSSKAPSVAAESPQHTSVPTPAVSPKIGAQRDDDKSGVGKAVSTWVVTAVVAAASWPLF
ncbi:hypothetical protein HPP92_021078 [Vanilla planifolia]|uniref:FAS1 domain-containing protein n=1 Tax=Vanilla planifolia TaxID=51239 RepID=A0A835UIM4_VANPL|nr:hypothetical protein HPP92_021078 [Vanilla planifolia]